MELSDKIEFVRRGSPSEWADYAVELHKALDILWQQEDNGLIIKYESFDQQVNQKTHISRTWLLLAAFSIENLLKGILIYEHPEYISNGSLASNVTNHSLTNLASGQLSCYFRVQLFQFDAGVGRSELPIHRIRSSIALFLPCLNFCG